MGEMAPAAAAAAAAAEEEEEEEEERAACVHAASEEAGRKLQVEAAALRTHASTDVWARARSRHHA
jgi:hypothetical protein